MSHNFTLISDLNSNQGMPMHGQHMPQQQMPMHGQHMPQQQMPMQPPQGNQFDMLKQYINRSDDSDSDSDDEESGSEGGDNWIHYYGIAILVMLAIILYFVYKIKKELMGIFEA